jgi:hypothetical protein
MNRANTKASSQGEKKARSICKEKKKKKRGEKKR